MKPVLQVALDLMNGDRAIKIAKEAARGGADWIEAGTPLIKSEGSDIIRRVKKEFPNMTVVADMKTMDVGGFETDIAARAGADIVSVMALSDDETVMEAIEVGRKYGTKIMADLIGVEDRAKRAKEVEKLGVDYICLHVGIDQQMHGLTPEKLIKEVADAVSVPVAAAGGINSETAPKVMEAGAAIVIVGGAIIKAEDVESAARRVKEAMQGVEVPTELFRKYGKEDIREAFVKVSTPNISDAMHRKGIMHGIIPRINHGRKMVGRALTVLTANGDWAKPVEAIDKAGPGEVIVIDVGGGDIAVWGELASNSCKTRGVEGVVIDGAARDIDSILDLDFPLFSRHAVPNAGEPKGFGGIGVEISCGGIPVRSGDWIIGDESGVVVVPQEIAVEIANRALDVMERENRLREEIKRGSTLSSVLSLERWEKVG